MIMHWTQAMTDCYERNCNCKGCHTKTLIPSMHKCFAKRAIVEYIKKYGVPEELETKGILE